MKCDYINCNNLGTDKRSCMWCNRKFHNKCLSISMSMFNRHNNIECSFCSPGSLGSPVVIDGLQLCTYGDYIMPNMELLKSPSERIYIYPIGYTCKRIFPSYMKPNSFTTVLCEILCVDENYFDLQKGCGKKDAYLFRLSFEDDLANPVEVLKSPKFLGRQIRERFSNSQEFPRGHLIFGLDNKYIQYLILLHVPLAAEVSINCVENLLAEMADSGIIDKYTLSTPAISPIPAKYNPRQSFIFNIHKRIHAKKQQSNKFNFGPKKNDPQKGFDPQKELFNLIKYD